MNNTSSHFILSTRSTHDETHNIVKSHVATEESDVRKSGNKNGNSYKLIVGLGNPGKSYQYTRHNIGFMAAERIANRYNFTSFITSSKFLAEISEGSIDHQKIFLIKPTTYMNLSGESVQKLKSYYKIDLSDIIVIHDDIDLEFGKIKVKVGGGHAGHNGLRSLDQHISKDYLRVRIGIGRPANEEVSDYVLNKFSKEELKEVEFLNEQIAININELLQGKIDQFIKNISS